jgi:hypothetical protein
MLFEFALVELLVMLLIFLIVFLGLSVCGFLFYFTDVFEFRSFFYTLVTLVQSVFGGLDDAALLDSNRYSGPLYALVYNLFVVLVVFNIIIAILFNKYKDANAALLAEAAPDLRTMLAENAVWAWNGVAWYTRRVLQCITCGRCGEPVEETSVIGGAGVGDGASAAGEAGAPVSPVDVELQRVRGSSDDAANAERKRVCAFLARACERVEQSQAALQLKMYQLEETIKRRAAHMSV